MFHRVRNFLTHVLKDESDVAVPPPPIYAEPTIRLLVFRVRYAPYYARCLFPDFDHFADTRRPLALVVEGVRLDIERHLERHGYPGARIDTTQLMLWVAKCSRYSDGADCVHLSRELERHTRLRRFRTPEPYWPLNSFSSVGDLPYPTILVDVKGPPVIVGEPET